MPELLMAQGGVSRTFCVLRGGYAGAFVGYGGNVVGLGVVCRNFWRLGGGMPEPLWDQGGDAGTFGNLRGGMPELLGA